MLVIRGWDKFVMLELGHQFFSNCKIKSELSNCKIKSELLSVLSKLPVTALPILLNLNSPIDLYPAMSGVSGLLDTAGP